MRRKLLCFRSRNKWRVRAGVLLVLSVIVGLLAFGQTPVQASTTTTLTVDLSGTWLAGISVELWSSNGATILWTQYNQQGAVRNYSVAPGTYDVKLVQGPKVLVIGDLNCSNDINAGDVTSVLTVDLSGTWLAGINVELHKDGGGLIWTAYNQQGAVRTYNVLKNTYDLKLVQGLKTLDIANVDCTSETATAGDVTSVLTVDLSGTWLAGINVELYKDNGGIIWTAYNQQGAVRTYNVLKNTYDLKLRQGPKVLDVANLDCTNETASVGDVTSVLTINLTGLGVSNIELHLNDSLVGSVGSLIWTAYNQSGTPVYNVLKNHYDVLLRQGSNLYIWDAVDCTGNTCVLDMATPNNSPVADDQTVATAEDTAKSITLTASDANGDTLTYSIVTPPSHGSLTGTASNVTYTPAANYNGSDGFTYKASDGAADSNVATVNITVNPVNDPPQAVNDSYTTNEDVALNIALPGVLVNDNDPDGNPITAIKVGDPTNGMLTLNSNGSFDYTPAANYNGPDSFTYKASDGAADSNVATVNITVNPVNDPPTLGAITVAPVEPAPISTPFTATATFNDPDLGDTHTATWDWGDGSSSAGNVDEAGKCIDGSHNYIQPGVYALTLTLSDGQATATAIYQYIVAYDPSGGFVTGGGWINSPLGAYQPNPSLTGKANFGFEVKYKKGATVPSGNTEFQFHAGNLNFHSKTFEWLVIAGKKAQFKGEGTINGTGSYRFFLTVIDGQYNGGTEKDKFRIKIWDRDTNKLVYDNLLNEPDDADPTTVIGGGNIKIHKP